MSDDVAGIYSVDLLFENPPSLSSETLLAALERRCPGVTPMTEHASRSRDMHLFAQTAHQVQYTEGVVPAQLMVIPGPRQQDAIRVDDALQQSWAEPGAGDLVQRARHQVLVSDLMARGLPYKERLGVFLDALEAIVTLLEPLVIHWRVSQQLMKPDRFLAARRGAEHVLFAGPLNVRFFTISNGAHSGEMLMDTMGLAVLGLPDLQCHFHSLEPNDVVPFLYNLGLYVFENGDVIEDGHTVEGTIPGEKWRCQHEDSMVPPSRLVLDINAGQYAAGNRA